MTLKKVGYSLMGAILEILTLNGIIPKLESFNKSLYYFQAPFATISATASTSMTTKRMRLLSLWTMLAVSLMPMILFTTRTYSRSGTTLS